MSREEYQIMNAAHDVVGKAAQILRNIDYCAQHGDPIGKDVSEMYLDMVRTQIVGTWQYLEALNRDIIERRKEKI